MCVCVFFKIWKCRNSKPRQERRNCRRQRICPAQYHPWLAGSQGLLLIWQIQFPGRMCSAAKSHLDTFRTSAQIENPGTIYQRMITFPPHSLFVGSSCYECDVSLTCVLGVRFMDQGKTDTSDGCYATITNWTQVCKTSCTFLSQGRCAINSLLFHHCLRPPLFRDSSEQTVHLSDTGLAKAACVMSKQPRSFSAWHNM